MGSRGGAKRATWDVEAGRGCRSDGRDTHVVSPSRVKFGGKVLLGVVAPEFSADIEGAGVNLSPTSGDSEA